MKNTIRLVTALVLYTVFWALAQPPAPATTAYTRTLLRAVDASAARTTLGVGGGGSTALNDIVAATGNASVDHGTNLVTWKFNGNATTNVAGMVFQVNADGLLGTNKSTFIITNIASGALTNAYPFSVNNSSGELYRFAVNPVGNIEVGPALDFPNIRAASAVAAGNMTGIDIGSTYSGFVSDGWSNYIYCYQNGIEIYLNNSDIMDVYDGASLNFYPPEDDSQVHLNVYNSSVNGGVGLIRPVTVTNDVATITVLGSLNDAISKPGPNAIIVGRNTITYNLPNTGVFGSVWTFVVDTSSTTTIVPPNSSTIRSGSSSTTTSMTSSTQGSSCTIVWTDGTGANAKYFVIAQTGSWTFN